MKEWAIPLSLAIVVGGLAYLYAPEEPTRFFTPDGPASRFDEPYVLAPAEGSHGPSTLLRYDATPRHGIGDFLDIHAGMSDGEAWRWDGRDGACLLGRGDCVAQGQAVVDLDGAAVDPGVVGPGNRSIEATFFLFDEDGYLLATNTPRNTWEGFDLHGDFTFVDDRVWHFGPGATPPDARAVPEFRAEVRGLLDGTHAGQVRTGVLVQHEYDWYFGPLWLTVRVDGIA